MGELVEGHTGMVYGMAKQMKRLCPQADFEDLVQEGMVGLVSAEEAFEPSRGNRFATFAHHRVRGAMRDFIRRETGMRASRDHITRVRTQPLEGLPFGKEPTARDNTSPLAGVERQDFWDRVEVVVGKVAGRLLYHHYHDGLLLRECAELEGKSDSWASVVLRTAHEKLRKRYTGQQAVDELLPSHLM